MNKEKEQRAIECLRKFEPSDEPYYLCYSGGKDSDCIRILAHLAGVKHDIVHKLTTVDAPETVRYVKSISNIKIEYPRFTMWQLIVMHKFPPTRLMRYCCEDLKEEGGQGRLKVTGVRWAESRNRKENSDFVSIIGKPKTTQKEADKSGVEYRETKKGGIVLNDDNAETRRFVEHCYRTRSVMINPIVDWSDNDVWEFLHYYGCNSNPLYQCGEKRIGCIGCPMQGGKGMKEDFAKYPKYKENYIRAFEKMLKAREEAGLTNRLTWRNGEDVLKWWTGDDPMQLDILDMLEEEL